MGKYNFDKEINRRNTNSIKYDFAEEKGMPDDLMPLWVADMDFETAPEIIDAVVKRAQHGIYGYTKPDEEFGKTLIQWMEKRHEWTTEADWYLHTPGVVFALNMAVRALTEEGDSVIIQRPVYYPFSKVILENNRKLVNSPLIYENGCYRMDVSDFEDKIIKNNVKMFILCNPHNPVGRVWTREELEQIGDICVRHGVIVISDEIHQDFIYTGYKHEVFARIRSDFADITVTCTSPSKTFNLAGLQISNVIISNRSLRDSVADEITKCGYGEPSLFGIEANLAAYRYGEKWLEELKEYLYGNIEFIRNFIEKRLPLIATARTEGTYLVWLDFKKYSMSHEDLNKRIIESAKLWLDEGTMFGVEGSGFQRVNVATTRSNIEKAMLCLEEALKDI